MDAKPHIFLSSLPDLTDYVTLHGEITTSGPHLLNCACCRALLRCSSNILCSPALNDKKRVYIVVHKNDVKKKEFSETVAACNLRLMKVFQITNSVFQCCLDFTIHTYLHPLWTRIKNNYYQGKSCLFQNQSMGCVHAQLNVQVNNVILALKATKVTLTVPKLSKFHVRDDTFRRFADKSIRTINSSEMGDNTCYVLPSFKPALVHSISYDIDENCPLKDKSDMIAYWLDYHGMLIPSDTNIFVTLSFNFPGAPTMTYPYYCVRKEFPALRHRTDLNSINDFISDVNNLLQLKLPNFHLNFPTDPLFYTAPNQSSDCLVKTQSEVVHHKQSEMKDASIVKCTVTKTNILPKTSAPKIKPRFNPYNESGFAKCKMNNPVPSVQDKIVPHFKARTVNCSSNEQQKVKRNTGNVTKPVFSELPHHGFPSEFNTDFCKNENFPRVESSIETTPKSKCVTKLSQNKTFTPRKPQTPSSIPSSFEHDDFDDFEIPQKLKVSSFHHPSPGPLKHQNYYHSRVHAFQTILKRAEQPSPKLQRRSKPLQGFWMNNK